MNMYRYSGFPEDEPKWLGSSMIFEGRQITPKLDNSQQKSLDG